MSVAFVFPGQGAQEVGMGRAMAGRSAPARDVFARADAALAGDPVPLSSLCFEGPEDALTRTANTQPAILATSLACLAALRERLPGLVPSVVAGHSLGEYSALVAAGALDLADAVRLVRVRGAAMQDAVPPGEGAMSAVLMLDDEVVRALCDEARATMPGRVVSPANFNAPGQVVVAGHADAVARVGELAAARRGRAVPLKVSAPFHCELMRPAAERLASELAKVVVAPPAFPLIANVDAREHADPARLRSLLVEQVTGTVLWSRSVRVMVERGVTTFVEVGPGRVLAGLIKRIHKGATVLHAGDPDGLDAVANVLGAA